MKGDPEILDILNNLLTHELTAINQYFIHHKMLLDWGYKKLSDKKRAESIEEMQHADEELDLELELEAVANLKKGIEICLKKADVGTRALLEKILVDEEEAIDWLETQLHLVDELGKSAYLAEHLE